LVMFEKIGRLAETAANQVSVSRRGFLGRLGQGALAVTGVLGGLLAIPTAARARGSYVCCSWTCHNPRLRMYHFCYPPGSTCRNTGICSYIGPYYSVPVHQKTVSSCSKCT
jgi:hypothetical protein